MDDSLRNVLRHSGSRWALVVLALGVAARPDAVSAAAVKAIHHPVHMSDQVQDFETYLAGGPTHWQHVKPPQVPAGLTIETKTGAFKVNSLTEFLAWEQNKNPQRFDARHPKIAPILARAQELNVFSLYPPLNPPTTASRASMSRTLVSLAGDQAQVVAAETLTPPNTVPEPSSWALGLVLAGSALGWRRLRASR